MTLRPDDRAGTLVVGAGIAGVAVAHALARRGDGDVVIVDERAPLSLTSAVSTECYRDWWPGPDPSMVQLMERSIDLLEDLAAESGNTFRMNRRGYLFASADPRQAERWRAQARQVGMHGGGPLRMHTGRSDEAAYVPSPSSGVDRSLRGVDLITDRALIARRFPYLDAGVAAVLHARRCGWLSAQQLGMYLLEHALDRGARVVRGHVDAIDVDDGRAARAWIDGRATAFDRIVVAAGPRTRDVSCLMGVDLPIELEPHLKVAFHDAERAIPRDAPFLIWSDPQRLEWDDDERAALRAEGLGRLADRVLPSGPHGRPEGDGDAVLMLWSHGEDLGTPERPDGRAAEIVLRGWSAMLPALRGYISRLPRPVVDGGYYARTPENRPIVGPLPVQGAYVSGALSGFGIMAAVGAADLLARHLHGEPLPEHAGAFLLERYADPGYRALMREIGAGAL